MASRWKGICYSDRYERFFASIFNFPVLKLTSVDIVVISRSNWERQKSFVSGHTGPITDIAWSPNGAFIASAGSDGKLLIWESEHQKVVARYDQSNIVRLAWHPSENIISFTNSNGELVTLPEAIPEDLASQLKTPLRAGTSLNGELEVRTKDASSRRRARSMSRDSLNDLLDIDEDEDDFIIDDDGAGYVEPGRGDGGQAKRRYDDLGADLPPSKRRAWDSWTPTIHEPFQPGSTPWRGNRRYLSLNLIGFVWTVDQETHNTVTVEFYDREAYRDFHFTDPFLYNKACLSTSPLHSSFFQDHLLISLFQKDENGTLFSSPSSKTHPATILYRPHETWSTRSDFRIQLPEGEEVISIALSDSYILACTSTSYVRVYSLFGIPVRIFRAKHHPIVTCASWRDYIMILGNGPIGPDGRAQLTYTIENVKRDATLQLNDVVALPSDGGELQSVFFTDSGDPVIYDSSGVLLILQHWRQPGQSRWVPILDTRSLERLAGGGKEESYWPVAVAQDKFHCIILKGGEKYPYFPRPLLSEFDFKVPIGSSSTLSTANDPSNPAPAHEETVVRQTLFLSLLEDFVGDRVATANEGHQRSQRENAVDKALLQLLALECKEDHGEKALELCSMFAQPRRTLELAIKVALKYNRGVLAGKIGEMRDEVVDLEMEM